MAIAAALGLAALYGLPAIGLDIASRPVRLIAVIIAVVIALAVTDFIIPRQASTKAPSSKAHDGKA